MGLKQSIVVKNQFTVKSGDNGGRRGKTPGRYVLRYMARKDATEPIAPIRQSRADDFIKKYMVRKDATEPLRDPKLVKQTAEDVVRFGGVAFGYGQIALSDEDLIKASDDIQKCFDEGKTVMKTVLSFDEDYLRENGIIDPNFVFQRAGDYKGHIDQMKLRKAIMSGLERFGRSYDDLEYVGVIQVDTGHVHCHLAMVDKGVGKLAPNGEQKGKMTQRSMNQLRRGIDVSLDDQKTIQFMASQYQTEKRNVKSFVKKMSYLAIDEHGLGQLMLAALPEDSRLWRSDSNNKRMKRANNLAREFVNKMFEKEGSGYREAQASVLAYVNKRSDREGLSEKDKALLIKNGYKKIEDKAINTVYETLRQYRGEDLTVHTRMMDIAVSDLDDLAGQKDDPLAQFGYRLRSYSSRRKHHMEEKHKYKQRVRELEDTPNRNEIADKFLEFYRFEAMYHAQLQAKYQSFLSFLPKRDVYEDRIKDLMDYEKRMVNLERMMNDKSMRKMNPDNAEVFGFSTYGQRGGHYVAEKNTGVLRTRLGIMQDKFDKNMDDLNEDLFDAGFKLVQEDDGFHLKPKLPYDFEDVKALDLHHLDYDFFYDADVSVGNVSRFVTTANERYELFKPVEEYLVRTDQEAQLEDFAVYDINKMKQYADDMKLKPVLKSKISEAGVIERAHNTIDLSRDLEKELQDVIQHIMHENVEDYFVEDRGIV
jgi:hypothetical protein